MAKNIKKKTQNKPVYMTISEANAHNAMTPNNAFMIGIGTEDSPEFIYPKGLEPAIVTSSKKESDYKQAEKEASTFRNRSLAGHIGTGLGLDLGDKSLQNIATTAIGIPLVSTNPVTTTLIKPLIKGAGHIGKVLLDPTKALTGVGQATATTADIYGTIEGLRQVPNATKNIIQGDGTAMDYFNLATGLMGPFGTFNALKAARVNPYLRQVAGYKNLGLEDGDRLNHIEQTTNNVRTPADDPIDQIHYDNYSATRWADEIANEARTQVRRNLGYSDDIDIDFDDEGNTIISRRGERIDQSGSSITNDIDELQRQDEEIDRITSMFPDLIMGTRLRALRDKNLLGRYIEKQTGKTLNDIADNYVLVDLQLVPINEIKTIMRNKGFKEEFINYSLQEFSRRVRSAVGNPSKANDIRGFTAHKYEPDFKTGTQEFKLNRVRTNPESGIKHIFENYFDIKYRMGRPFNDTSRINDSDKEILNELITMYNKDTSSNISFDDLQDVDKFADLRNYLRSKYTDKKLPGDINSLAWNDAEHFGEFKPFSTTSNYDASKVLKKTADMINSIPRGYSLAVDDTSYDSEMLKLIEVLKHRKNYGRNPGQLSVESLGSTSWGNDFHKEQIRIGDILNEYRDKLSQNDIDYIESIINRNPKGNPSPELINIIKQKYETLGEELSISMKRMWDRILQLDPSLKINTNTIEYEPFNERDAIRDIVFKGKTTPRIHRPDIRIHRNRYGGNNKFKFEEIKQNKIFKLNGGMAVPLDDKKRLFYLSGAKHEQGGIDVTPELEAEGGEVIKVNPKSIKVVTAQKIMGGKSPAELVVNASSTGEQDKVFNKVFKYQEDFKDRHNLNDDGTSKAKFGILKKFKNWLFNIPSGFERVKENDSPTKEASEFIENDISKRQESFYKIAKEKGHDSEPYFIPYIDNKEIIINGAGRASSNMLDSLVVNSKKAKVPFTEALGLAVEESKMGAIPNVSTKAWEDSFMKTNGRKPNNDEIKEFENKILNSSFARNFGGIHPQFLINNHEWFKRGWEDSNKYKNILKDIKSPLQHGLTLYKLGLYNTGDKYHKTKVRSAGNKAIKSKDVQNWLKTSEYAKQIEKYKLGGETKKEMGGNKSTKTWQQTSRESMKENLSGMVDSIKYLNTNRQERYNATGEKSSFNEFTNNWYNHPTTKSMMGELNTKNNLLPSKLTVPTTSGEISLTPNQQMTYHLYGAMSTPMKYQNLINTKAGHYSKPELGNINMSNTARLKSNNYFNFNVKDPKYLEDNIRLDPNKGMNMDYLKTHEIDHAVQARMPFLLDTTKQFNTELKEGITPDSYLDSKEEIRSRLMELRQHFNLDPSKRDYTPEEAAKFQEEIKHLNTGASTLDRYTPETLANYLNFMANNTVNKSYNNLHNATNIKGMKIAKWGTQYKNKSGKTITVKPAISQLSVPSNMIGSATIQTPTPFVPKKWEDTNKINLNPTEETDKLLNAGDWINLGLNSAGALTNLITGLATPDIKYARMKDSIPIMAPKINTNVNTTAEENAIDEAYYSELNAIDENTANSQTALNRKRNAAARRAAAKIKVRSAAENTRRGLINESNKLAAKYQKYNIARQENIDAYNRQAEAAEFNANRTNIGDAITGFVSDLGLGASTIANTIERREADKINTVLSYMGNPEVNPSEFGKGFDNIYKELYGKKPSNYLRKKYSKR